MQCQKLALTILMLKTAPMFSGKNDNIIEKICKEGLFQSMQLSQNVKTCSTVKKYCIPCFAASTIYANSNTGSKTLTRHALEAVDALNRSAKVNPENVIAYYLLSAESYNRSTVELHWATPSQKDSRKKSVLIAQVQVTDGKGTVLASAHTNKDQDPIDMKFCAQLFRISRIHQN